MPNTLERWYARTDPHPVVEAWKKKVRGRPHGALGTLQRQRTLGVLLLALGRGDEALPVWDEAAAAVRWTGKSSPWAIASWCAALAYWARLRRGDPPSGAALGKFNRHEAHAAQRSQPELWTRARFAEELASCWEAFEGGRKDTGRYGLDTMAFHLSRVAFFRVIDVLAPVHRGKLPARATDAALERGLRAVAEKAAAPSKGR